MKDKLLARIWARRPGPRVMTAILSPLVALIVLFAYAALHQVITAPPRLHKGEEIVLIDKEGPINDHAVCVVVENPHDALFIGEWEGGTVLADEGSVWAVDRGVDVRLRGPEVLGWGYRDDEKYHTYLKGDGLNVRVGRSYVVPRREAVESMRRQKAADHPRREEPAYVIVEKNPHIDETSRLAGGEPVVLLEHEGALSRGISIVADGQVFFVPDGTRGTVLVDEDGDRHNYHRHGRSRSVSPAPM